MRILFVTYSRALLGANKSMINLIKELRSRYAVEPCVLMSDVNDGDLAEALGKENIPYVVGPMSHWVCSKNDSFKLLRGLNTSVKNRENIKQLSKVVDFNSFDLIYSNNGPVIMGALIAKKYNKPHIWHIREFGGSDYDFVYDYPAYKVRKYFADAKIVFTVSKGLEEYVKAGICKDANVVTIYNGIESIHSEKQVFNKTDILHFCIVGALTEGKNQMELLKAACLLKDELQNFHIDIIGNGEEYEKQLREYVSDNKLDKFVTFHGYLEDANEVLKTMDVGVICSKAEAFGRVTVEYMNASMPVIGANTFGTAEIVENNVNGILYELGDIKVLSDAIKRFINDRTLLEFMGKNAYKRSKDFTIEANADSIFKAIESVL